MMAVNPGEEKSVAFSHVTVEDLLAEVRQYLTPHDMEAIQRAYYVANQARSGDNPSLWRALYSTSIGSRALTCRYPYRCR